MKNTAPKVTVQVDAKVVGMPEIENEFSIASCKIMKRYPPLEGCDAVITTFNFQGRHYIIYVKKDVQPID